MDERADRLHGLMGESFDTPDEAMYHASSFVDDFGGTLYIVERDGEYFVDDQKTGGGGYTIAAVTEDGKGRG